MSTLPLTLLIAFVLVLGAIALMAIGWLITGKSKILPGACGRDPTKKQTKGKECGTSAQCQLCEKEEPKL